MFHSQPKSTVGTPAYIAPEVLSKKEYDGKVLISFSFSLIELLLYGFEFSLLSNLLNYSLQMFGRVE